MDRKPQQQTERSRRSTTGVTLVATAIVATIATAYASSAMPGREGGPMFPSPSTAVPLETTATRLPRAVYLKTSSGSFAISRQGSATPGE